MPAPPNPTPHRLGFHLAPGGAAISVWAPHASALDLCLFDSHGAETRVALLGPDSGLWHAYLPGVRAGQRYGLRATGPFSPDRGHVFNPAKLLLDPYARGIEGDLASVTDDGFVATLSNASDADSAPAVPRGVLLAPPGKIPSTAARVPWEQTVIYEGHVRGLTQRLDAIPRAQRGTYAALGHDAFVRHLSELGVTTLELLPVHASATETHLQDLGLSNYWGYSTLGFFAPHAAYASTAAQRAGARGVADEFRGAIDRLHRAGIEVVLDVVYNHTCEGGNGGRQISWRGLGNLAYYRQRPDQPGLIDDTTGTGNTLDFSHPRVTQMALDSLRYWASDFGVDGFRFDLAATLGRSGGGFDPHHPFLVGITTDPIIGATKLIAEPWDVGLGGWQTGSFPAPMAEWNDRFRDSVRTFWLQDGDRATRNKSVHGVRDLATRLAGSSDLFGGGDPPLSRGPIASINFVACHDGFTLHDLTAYAHKHNEANGEGGRDGTDNNRSWNHGAEGPTDDAAILAARRQSARNLVGTLLLSAGVPMIGAGDEFARTQAGNNNAYCQDNELSWLDWERARDHDDLRETVAYLARLRRENPVLRPRTFYEGRDRDETRRDDLGWYTAMGDPESRAWWHDATARVLQMMRSLSEGPDALVIINGYAHEAEVTVPPDGGPPWALAWDSAWETPAGPQADRARAEAPLSPGAVLALPPLSMRLYLGA